MSVTSIVEVGPKGRVVIPAAIRRELGLHQGRELVAMIQDGAVVFMPREEIKRRLRAMFAHVRTSMADELIAERHAESEREDAE